MHQNPLENDTGQGYVLSMRNASPARFLHGSVLERLTLPTCTEVLFVDALGRSWSLSRFGDLESLWEGIGQDDLDGDERLPYWVELWPAAMVLARWLADNRALVSGALCLDAGCGLGFTAMAGAWLGGRVAAVDYEPEAAAFTAGNAGDNLLGGEALLPMVMDWREPAFRDGAFDLIWGADILYEKRFFEPLAELFDRLLAPGGRIWVAEPRREVSAPAWERFRSLGWRVETPRTEKGRVGEVRADVNIRELTR